MSRTTSVKLFAPREYQEADPYLIDHICKGCGAGSGWKEKIIPDTIWGLNIREACKIHDWMYYWGNEIKDKESADRTFLNNMMRLIESRRTSSIFSNILAALRRRRALKYYEAVVIFGGPAFWANVNDLKDIKTIPLLP